MRPGRGGRDRPPKRTGAAEHRRGCEGRLPWLTFNTRNTAGPIRWPKRRVLDFHGDDETRECSRAGMLRLRQEIRRFDRTAPLYLREAAFGSLRPAAGAAAPPRPRLLSTPPPPPPPPPPAPPLTTPPPPPPPSLPFPPP